MDKLDAKLKATIEVFRRLPTDQKYNLCFSGGKDSTAVLWAYLLAKSKFDLNLDLRVVFSDTLLEEKELLKYVKIVFNKLENKGIKTEIVKPKKHYLWYQFIKGYPVPHHKLRWCTDRLKIAPMRLGGKRISIVGTHYGESVARDNRLKKTCGGSECGVDLLKSTISPILNWTTDDVWVFLLKHLPANLFNLLANLYDKNLETKTGSLRMGCLFCPVVSINTLNKSPAKKIWVQTSEFFQTIREMQFLRIASPKTKSRSLTGAIHVVARRMLFEALKEAGVIEELILLKSISSFEIEEIEKALKSDYCYPQNYEPSHVDFCHKNFDSSLFKYLEEAIDTISKKTYAPPKQLTLF